MTNQSYKEIIVVEGKNDKARILEIYPNALVMITNGSEVSENLIEALAKLSVDNKVILFLDPDYPGQRIRSILEQRLKNFSHAFLPKKKAIDYKKHKVGIEHASHEDIKEALDNLLTPTEIRGSLTLSDLYELGLTSDKNATEKRLYLEEVLNVGYANSKTLLKRLNYLNISKKELEELLNAKDWND